MGTVNNSDCVVCNMVCRGTVNNSNKICHVLLCNVKSLVYMIYGCMNHKADYD